MTIAKPTHRPAVRRLHSFRARLLGAVLGFACLASCLDSHAAPSADGPLAERLADLTPRQRNLVRLICALDQVPDGFAGELGDVVQLLRGSNDPLTAVQALKALLPELARHREQRQLRPRSRKSTPKSQDTNPRPKPQLFWLAANTAYDPQSTVWSQAWTERATHDDREGIDGYDADGSGLTIGFDRTVTENTSVGFSITRSTTDLDSDALGEDELTSDEYAVFGSWFLGNQALSLSITRSNNDADRTRVIVVNTDAGRRALQLFSDVSSKQSATTLGWQGTLSLSENVSLSPFVSGGYAKLETDDYIESGGGNAGLLVETDDETQIVGRVGASLDYAAFAGNWIIVPSISVIYEHDFKADDTRTFSRFRGTQFGFESTGYSTEPNRWRGSLGVQFVHANGFGLALSVDGETKDDYSYGSAILGIQYTF